MDSSEAYCSVYNYTKERINLFSVNSKKNYTEDETDKMLSLLKEEIIFLLGESIHYFPKFFIVDVLSRRDKENENLPFSLKDIFVEIINSFSEKCDLSSAIASLENLDFKSELKEFDEKGSLLPFVPDIHYIFEKFKDLIYFNFDKKGWHSILQKYNCDRNFYYIFVKNTNYIPINRTEFIFFYRFQYTNEFLRSFSNEEWMTYEIITDFLYGEKSIDPHQETACYFLLRSITIDESISFVSKESEKFVYGWLKNRLDLERLLRENVERDSLSCMKFIFLAKYAEKHFNFKIPEFLFEDYFYKQDIPLVSKYLLLVWDICTYEKENERIIALVKKTLSKIISNERKIIDFAHLALSENYRKTSRRKRSSRPRRVTLLDDGRVTLLDDGRVPEFPLNILMLREVIFLQCKVEYTKFGYWKLIQ